MEVFQSLFEYFPLSNCKDKINYYICSPKNQGMISSYDRRTEV